MLGLRSVHWDCGATYFADILRGREPSFRVYDDVDAVSDVPAACFYEELLACYPAAKCVLTVRDENAWWASLVSHTSRYPLRPGAEDETRRQIRHMAYGSSNMAAEYVQRKRYREHNQRVRDRVAPSRLLVMDIAVGDGWNKLCPFLGIDEPHGTPFPHANASPIT